MQRHKAELSLSTVFNKNELEKINEENKDTGSAHPICCLFLESQQRHSLLFKIAEHKVSKCLLFISEVSVTWT